MLRWATDWAAALCPRNGESTQAVSELLMLRRRRQREIGYCKNTVGWLADDDDDDADGGERSGQNLEAGAADHELVVLVR